MTNDLLDSWLQSSKDIPWSYWETFREQYFDRLGVDADTIYSHVPQHPAMARGAPFRNWLRLLPEDTVTRLRNTQDFETELEIVITETHDNMKTTVDGEIFSEGDKESDADIESGQLGYLCSRIISQLRGDVRVNKLLNDELTVPTEPAMDPPEYLGTVTVERRNERNFEDIAIYDIEDGVDFFGSRYGDSSLMLEAIYNADIEPDFIVSNVAFNTEGNSWGKSTPPEDAISVASTDHKNRSSYSKVKNPTEYFGDSWGDISEMVDILNNNREETEYEHLYSTGVVDWQIAIGI